VVKFVCLFPVPAIFDLVSDVVALDDYISVFLYDGWIRSGQKKAAGAGIRRKRTIIKENFKNS